MLTQCPLCVSTPWQAGMESQWCGKLHMTEVLQEFPCDVFFPEIDQEEFTLVE